MNRRAENLHTAHTAHAPYAQARVLFDAPRLLELIEITTTRHEYKGTLVHEASLCLAGGVDGPCVLVSFESSIDEQSGALELDQFRVVGRCDSDEHQYAVVDEAVDHHSVVMLRSHSEIAKRIRMEWRDEVRAMREAV